MKKYSYQDIALVPRSISNIISRDDIKIQNNLNYLILSCPIIASPMKDVCDAKIAKLIRECGGYGILHRFCSIDEQVAEYLKIQNCSCAIGINDDYLERFQALYDVGCKIFTLDVANGGNIQIKNTIEKLLKYHDDVNFIVGNVASAECFAWLQNLSKVSAVRVGVATGSGCATYNATGIYHPMFSLIQECNEIKTTAKLIADGGIKEPSDFCKAIAAGADFVMMGAVIANAVESPAEIIKQDNKYFKLYRGSSSFDIQSIYKVPKYIEGKNILLEHKQETLKQILNRFMDGLRSCMSYFGATTIKEFQSNIDSNNIVEVNNV